VGASGISTDPGSNFNVFRQGLRDLGYVEGKNILIENRNAEGKLELIPILVDELVQLKIDVLVSTNPIAIRAAKQATKTIPIVMVSSADPVATGIVDSLARPGGNITGLSLLARDLSGKRLELLTEAVPGVRRVGVLWDADSSAAAIGLKEYEAAARVMKVQLQSLEVRGPSPDLENAFASCDQGARGRAHHGKNLGAQSLSETHRRPRYKEPTTFNVRGKCIRRGRRPHVLCQQRC
jgi:ABC transporter substrate binding protein